MSIDIPTELLTASSGSVGDVVSARNQHGPYTRARTAPTDPGSAAQLAVRAALSQCVNAWNSTLTQTERESWERYALAVRLSGRLGRRNHAGGIGMYIRSNVPRLQAAEATLPRVDVAPTPQDLSPLTPVVETVLNFNDDTLHPFFTEADAWTTETGAAMLFWISTPQPLTRHFWRGPYRFAGSLLGSDPTLWSPGTISLPYPAAATERAFARARVTRSDGRLSSSIYLTADAAPQVRPQFLTASIEYGPPPWYPMTLTVTFDSPIRDATLDTANWRWRYNDYMFDPHIANASGGKVVLTAYWGAHIPGPQKLWYMPRPFDVWGLLTGMTVLAFYVDWP